jgi:predicted DsbA family dithiol-disulfide isomerase
VDKAMAQMKQTADNLGLEFGVRRMTYNSRLAQEVGLWAETCGKGHLFHMNAFRAYFADGRNIAEKQVLLDIIRASGLDLKEGLKVIEDRTFSDAVDRDWELSRAKGVNAVPTFFMGLDKLVGAQPYEVMEKMVEKYCR